MNKIVFRFVSISFSILVMLLVLVGFVEIGSYFYDFGYRVFAETPVDAAPGRDVTVQITDDMSGRDVAKELEEKGLVEDAKLFYVQLRLSAYAKKINAGVFTLNTSMTSKEMMVALAAKPVTEETEQTEQTETAGDTGDETETTEALSEDADVVTGE